LCPNAPVAELSMTTGHWNFCRNSVATLRAIKTTGFRVVPSPMKIWRFDHLGDVDG